MILTTTHDSVGRFPHSRKSVIRPIPPSILSHVPVHQITLRNRFPWLLSTVPWFALRGGGGPDGVQAHALRGAGTAAPAAETSGSSPASTMYSTGYTIRNSVVEAHHAALPKSHSLDAFRAVQHG